MSTASGIIAAHASPTGAPRTAQTQSKPKAPIPPSFAELPALFQIRIRNLAKYDAEYEGPGVTEEDRTDFYKWIFAKEGDLVRKLSSAESRLLMA
jgi:hypothetical protein